LEELQGVLEGFLLSFSSLIARFLSTSFSSKEIRFAALAAKRYLKKFYFMLFPFHEISVSRSILKHLPLFSPDF
jgi:hypothetical protein